MPRNNSSAFPARRRLIAVAISACFSAAPAWSNPTAPQVVSGSASFSQKGNLLTVTNSSGAIINWNSFSIGANESTRFNQPSAASGVLNRVIANDPSVLLGTLSSNGKVWLVNPSGIMVGQGARIDVGGFVASTLAVRNEDFLAGRLNFQATPNAGKIENYGQITTPSGGSVYLVAPAVENHGIINAPNGEVILAAGQKVDLIDTGTPGVKVEVAGSEGSATNLGEILSEAGRIGMAGVLVKNSGALNASSIVREGGRIFLKASQRIELEPASRIAADGTRGGEILVKTETDGRLSGELIARGSISAQGDGGNGTGGFIETSAARLDIDNVSVTTGGGNWLLDPSNVTIQSTGSDTFVTGGPNFVSINDGSIVTTGSIQTALNAGTNVSVTTGVPTSSTQVGDINVNSTITKSSGSAATLTLSAHNNVNVNATITSSSASSPLNLTMIADSDSSAGGQINIGSNIDLKGGLLTTNSAGSGKVAISGGTVTLDQATTFSDLTLSGGTLAGAGAATANALSWTSGTLLGSLTLASAGSGTLSTTSGKYIGNSTGTAGTFTNAGTLTDSTPNGYWSLYLYKGTFDNQGSYSLANDAILNDYNGNGVVNNSGTFTKSGGTGTSTVNPKFVNTGTVNVSSGTLQLSAPSTSSATHTGTFNVASSSVLEFSDGTHTFDTGSAVNGPGTLAVSGGTLNANGTLGSTLGLTLSGGTANFNADSAQPSLSFTGGTLGGAGTLSTYSLTWSAGTLLGSLSLLNDNPLLDCVCPGTGTLSGSSYKYIGNSTGTAGTFTNAGTLTDSSPNGYTSLYLYKGSFDNQGSYSLANDAILNDYNGNGVVNNSGTFTKSGGTGTSTINPKFVNTGTVNASSGTLQLSAPSTSSATHTGTFNVASGSVLQFASGTHTLDTSSTVSGPGTLGVSGGTLSVGGTLGSTLGLTLSGGTANFNADSAQPSLSFSSGTLGGTGTLSTNSLSWTAGTVLGSLKLASAGTGTLSGSSYKYIGNSTGTAGTFTNAGTLTDNSPNGYTSLYLYKGSFDNQGSYSLANDAILNDYNGNGVINNSGTFTKSGGTGTSTINPKFVNTGTVNASSGTLQLSAPSTSSATHTGTFNVASGSVLQFASGTHTLNNTFSGSGSVNLTGGTLVPGATTTIPVFNFSGGTISGTGVLTANSLAWTSGTLLGSLALASGGTGTLSTSSYKYIGNSTGTAGTFTNAGTLSDNSPNGYTSLYLYKGSFDNQGSYSLANDAILNDYNGNGVINNSGTFTKSGGTGTSTINPKFVNTGTVNASSGTLQLSAPSTSSATHTGTFNVASGATLQFASGTHTLNNTFSGSGSVNLTGGTLVPGAATTIPVFNFSGGTISGTGVLTANSLAWTSGTLLGSLALASGGTGTLSTTGGKYVGTTSGTVGTFTNAGTLSDNTPNGYWSLYLYNGTFNNQGSYTLTTDAGLYDYLGISAINNTGTFTKGGGTGTSTIYPKFSNTGTVNVNSGTLNPAFASSTNNGTIALASGAAVSTGALTNASTGSITGSGTLDLGTATLTNNGTIAPGSSSAAGALSVTGKLVLGSSSTLKIKLGGTSAGTYDKLAVTGNVTMGGTLNVSLTDSYVPAAGDAHSFLGMAGTATGTFATTSFPGNIDVGYNLYSGEAARTVYVPGPGTRFFNNSANNLDWGTAANWSGGLPSSSDEARIDTNFAVTHATGTDTVGALTITGGNSLNVSGGSLTVGGNTTLGGTLTVSGTGSTQLNGTLSGTGTAAVEGGTLAINGTTSELANVSLSGGTLTGTGNLTISNGFSRTGGTLGSSFSGLSITQASGNLAPGSLAVTGPVSLAANAGALILDSISGTKIAGSAAGGDLTLNSGAALSASGAGDAVVLATSGNFVNNAGASALSAPNGRWLVYSTNPSSDTKGGLAYNFKHYGLAYGGGAYSGPGSGNGFIYSVAPSVTPGLTGTASKVYDGTAAATLAPANFAVSGALDGDTIVLDNPVSGSYADRHAGSGKTVSTTVAPAGATNGAATVYGYQLASTTASGSVGEITPRPLALSAAADSKVYDGTTIASVNLSDNRLTGDALTPSYASAAFADKNVGAGKAVTVSGIGLSGADAGNYTLASTSASTSANISIRPLSTWTGSANNLWSNPANWDAIPDGSNVLAVSIPSGSGQVTYETTAGSTTLQNLNSAQTLALAGGTLAIGGTLSTTGYAQSGGALTGNGSLSVSSSFSQTGGSIALGGTAAITQVSGNLQVGSLAVPVVTLAAQNGAITQSAPVVASSLITQSVTGTSLGDAGNKIASFTATNSGSGNVVLTNSVPLTIAAISNSNGNITVDNTGAVATTGAIIAPNGAVSIQARSPLAIGANGVSAGGSISLVAGATSNSDDLLTISGPVGTTASTGSVTLSAADGISQSASVSTGGCGVTAIAQAGDIVMAPGATTSTQGGAIGYTATNGNIVLTSLNAGSGAISLDAGGSILAAPNFVGTNLIGESALIAARGNAYLSTQVSTLMENVEGDYAIKDVVTGKVITGDVVPEVLPETTAPVVNQVVTTIVATSQQEPAKAAVETVPPPVPVPATTAGAGLLTLASTNQTIGGTEGTFGGTPTPAAPAGAPAASTSASGGGEGEKPATDKTAAIKPTEDKPAEAKKDEAKKDDDKKDDEKKKKEQETTAKKEEKKAAAKKAPVCN